MFTVIDGKQEADLLYINCGICFDCFVCSLVLHVAVFDTDL